MKIPSIVLSPTPLREQISAAKAAEAAGFSSVWTTEFHHRSATVPLGAIAQATSTIGVGTAIAYAFGRTPVVLAAEIRDLDELSDGRLRFGLGTGTTRMQRDWHGLDGQHPAPRMEELLPLVRKLWRLHEGPQAQEGRFYRVDVKPTAPVDPPLRPDVPLLMAGVNARMIQAAGRVSDGLIGHPLFTDRYIHEIVRPALADGAARTGRDAPPLVGYLTCCINEDRTVARQQAAAVIAFNSTVKTYRAIHELHGFLDAVDAVRTAWANGDFPGMIAAVTDEMIDTIALAGTPDEVKDRYATRAAVYDDVLLWPPAFAGADATRAVIDTLGPANT
ncbi:LLM class flavin-dependent oxidoreductase [Patulibacter brassicae]|jgi:probable F420-dependent oxidoreductase|uniref:LLM class flavin-dependent oxidoreductase n=1 Tax=Patulibacter brassicae TaxID=1705717 RepID=A0ABU4VG72_9ACTN|nr:LLM class flavin-dependent oxidoreductase [Patulibacter brassicae]MDX8150704.1 LLM class flavin-dependent oxidoreductase [Patulibacter brassicae]